MFSRSYTAISAMLGGAVLAAAGPLRLFTTHEGPQSELSGAADYVLIVMFLSSLLLISPVFLELARYARDRRGAIAATAGTAVLGVVCITSVINGKDLSIFNVLAPLTNAAWLFGSIALAVSLKRAGRVHRPCTSGCRWPGWPRSR